MLRYISWYLMIMTLVEKSAEVDYRCLTRGGLWGGLWGRGLGVGVGSFFVGFRGRVRVGDSTRGVIYERGKDLFTFFCLFTLMATLATPCETRGFRGRVRVVFCWV